MNEKSDALAAKLAPYRTEPGVVAALLISRDGFVVASDADQDFNVEAVAAQIGGIIDIGARLATELGQQTTRYLTIELDSLNVVLAPFGDELMLVLAGDPATLRCEYRLVRAGS